MSTEVTSIESDLAVVDVRGLRKSFGRREVLHGIDFSVPAGSVFGVIGPNGAGKTTTMRCLLDIIRPSGGSIRVLGRDPRTAGPALRRRIGYLPGELFLEGRVTGRRMLEHYAAISGPVRPGRIEELAERLDLDLGRHARKLSKGNKQKLGLIQAFMHEPELLVLDEPTSGLDPLVQQEFLAMVREAQAAGTTVFLSSHMLSEIQQAADEVAILRDGNIVTVSTVDALRESAVRTVRFTAAESPSDVHAALSMVPGIRDVSFQEISPAQPLGPGFAVEVSAKLEGAGVGSLVRALARLDLVELVIEEADLEESVLTLYEAVPVETTIINTPARRSIRKVRSHV
ncbi:ABC transporter ATP-binding protein [Arthrobacter sp. M4]|uniref:ABC transporter ATP-binding protein n=1 Tax=Arthrobacter sp. M4 TaxID=218160 RepID=UPI001CDBD7F4|nr:ABC transporter ATP-binding protein [Arthrobacter sp. M4]MCA4132931.1 ABC transporter ATP-binding protein [Arthrobacter sp. M4]